MTKRKLFSKWLSDQDREKCRNDNVRELVLTLEHKVYKNIPGTNNSVRHDKGNTNTKTQAHAHVFAKRNGQGKELYSVNMDGTGHDGSSGKTISSKQAEYFCGLGFSIPDNLTLESLSYTEILKEEFEFYVLTEDAQPLRYQDVFGNED